MDRSNRSRLIKKCLISVAWLAGSAASTFMLTRDLTQTGGDGTGVGVARLERKHSVVRRRFASSYLWRDMEIGESVFHRDWIRGGGEVVFKDGSIIELADDSLVMIDDNADLTLNYAQGSLIVRSVTGDREIHIDSKGHREEKKITVRLLEPAVRAVFYALPKRTLHVGFTWKQKTDKSIRLQFASNEHFFHAQFIDVETGALNAETALGSGKYYWRLLDGDVPLTETRYFDIKDAEPITQVFPEPSQILPLFDDKQKISFRWLPPNAKEEAHVSTEIEASQDSQFLTGVVKSKVMAAAGQIRLDGFGPGNYFWRVSRDYPDFTVRSPVLEFTVTAVPKIEIALEGPLPGAAMEWRPDLSFHWNGKSEFPSDTTYTIEVAPLSGTKEVFSTFSRSYTLKNPPLGKSTWKVTAHRESHLIGESTFAEFNLFKAAPIVLLSPKNKEEIIYRETKTVFPFSWKNQLGGDFSSYSLELSRDVSFRTILKSKDVRESSVESSALDLADGKWFWRVRAKDSQGSVIRESEVYSVFYGPPPLLKSPKFARPESGTVLILDPNGDDPPLKWDPVDEAKSYEVKISGGPREISSKTTEPKLLLRDLKNGTYRWTVRAIDSLGRPGEELAPRELTIKYGAPLPAPKISGARTK